MLRRCAAIAVARAQQRRSDVGCARLASPDAVVVLKTVAARIDWLDKLTARQSRFESCREQQAGSAAAQQLAAVLRERRAPSWLGLCGARALALIDATHINQFV